MPHKLHNHVFHIAQGHYMNTMEVTQWKSSVILHKVLYDNRNMLMSAEALV